MGYLARHLASCPLLYLKRFPTTQEPEAGNAKYLVTLYSSSIFLRAIFFLMFFPLVFDGFTAGFRSFVFFIFISLRVVGAQQ